MSQVVGLPNNSYKPITITAWVRVLLCKLQKGCTLLAAASDKVYQLLVHSRWFSLGTPASSTTNTGRCDIAEILLKVALNTINLKSTILREIRRSGIIGNHLFFELSVINYEMGNISNPTLYLLPYVRVGMHLSSSFQYPFGTSIA